ncbi:hypothetical protein D5086_028534 [Populus alba]|uniref:Uncharacterized protein n=1 Tax=Populus alba TaxID=43335 RepID=A0ACC4AYF7_POPAL
MRMPSAKTRMVKTTKNMRVWTTMAFPLVSKLLNCRRLLFPGTWNNRPGESRMKSTKPSNIGESSVHHPRPEMDFFLLGLGIFSFRMVLAGGFISAVDGTELATKLVAGVSQ